MRRSSMTALGDHNEKLVLQTIRRAEGGVGQAEVVRRSGLSRQAVSVIVRRLLDGGLVRSAGRRSVGPGKPTTLLQVVAESRLTVGVHLDAAHIAVVVCDLLGHPVAQRRLDPPTADPLRDIERIAATIAALRRELEEPTPGTEARVLGIGVASPAAIDARAGVVRNPPWLPGWRDVPVTTALGESTGLPALLDKDTIAALTGEVWTRHLPARETVLYVYVGHGVGSAVSTGGSVHRGASTQAGEIGHLPTGRADAACSCGSTGCLSLFTDAGAVLDYGGVGAGRDAQGLARGLKVLAARAHEGDGAEREAIRRYGDALGRALRVLSQVHDPDRIIIGGPQWPVLGAFALQPARDHLTPWLGAGRIELEASRLGDAVGAIGAACRFLESELSPRGLGVQ